MKKTSLLGLGVTLAAAAAAGCVDGASDAAIPDEVTWRAQVYDRAELTDRAALGEAARATAGADRAVRADEAPLASRSREALAEQLRVALLHPNGGVYVAREPNWEAADAVLHPSGPVDRVPNPAAERVTEALGARAPALAAALAPALAAAAATPAGTASLVIGGDGRTLSPTTVAPFDAIARVQVYSSPTGGGFRTTCTGSYIGPWTLVLAGHCLRFTDGTFARRLVIEPARTGSSVPRRYDCANGDGSTTNDFLAAVPSGYTGALDHSLDFAVIDTYPCHAPPAWFAGYSVNTGTTTYTMAGYPLGRCPGAGAEGTSMCGMSGTGYVNEWRLESSEIDATDGQDGAPWWTTNPTRVAGVHNGYREYFDFGRCGFDVCRRNYARRIDGAMDTFIRSISYDY